MWSSESKKRSKRNIFIISTYIFFKLISMSVLCEGVRVAIPLHLSKISNSNLQSIIPNKRYNNIQGQPGEGYFISVLIGTPPQKINVLIDTGSSNFAIACQSHPYIQDYFHPNKSSTFQSTETQITVPYTIGKWSGYLASDLVQLNNLTSVRGDIACITEAENFFVNGSEWQGILGMAYPVLSRPSNKTVPLFDTMVNNSIISNVFSLQLCGENGNGAKSAGTLLLGGIDRDLHIDHIRYTPLRRAWYYEVVITSLRVGDKMLDVDCKELNNDKSIVDSGTTNLRLPKLVFDKLISRIDEEIEEIDAKIPADFWAGTTFLCSDLFAIFPELRISLVQSRNSTFTLVITPKQYLRPVENVEENKSCYKFAITSSDTGTVLGAVIMEGFYVVFDRKNSRIGFAKSSCNKNEFGPEIEGPLHHEDPWSCVYEIQPNRALQIVSYMLIGLSIICVVPLLAMFVQWFVQRWRNRKMSRLIDSNSVTSVIEE